MFHIDEDITRASTIPSAFYTGKDFFELSKEKIFSRTWQLAATLEDVKTPGQTFPFVLLPGCLDEPLLLTRR